MAAQMAMTKAKHDQRFGGIKIEEGEYVVTLQKCTLDIRKSDDANVLQVEALIVDGNGGKFNGYVAFDQMNMNNEWGGQFAIRFIEIAGYSFPDPKSKTFGKDLVDTVHAINKDASSFKVAIVHSGDFVNVNFKELLDGAPEQVEEASSGVTKKKTTAGPAKKNSGKEEEEEEQESPEVDVSEYEDMTRKELKAFIEENELDIKVKATIKDDKLRLMVAEAMASNEEEDGEETEGETGSSEESKPTDDELKADLLTFIKAHQVPDAKKSMDLDTLIEIIEEYEFPKSELDSDEIDLLTTLQLEDSIKED